MGASSNFHAPRSISFQNLFQERRAGLDETLFSGSTRYFLWAALSLPYARVGYNAYDIDSIKSWGFVQIRIMSTYRNAE